MEKKKSTYRALGGWAFLIGALVALILGALPSTAFQPWVVGLLLILGILVGFLNISDKEIVAYLVACVAFLVAATVFSATVGSVSGGFEWLARMLTHIAVFVVPAAIIASLKAIFALAGSR